MVRYWEQEQPETAQTAKVRLAYFPVAGKLQVSRLWRDPETGEVKLGKTATLDVADLQKHAEARELLRRFLEAARG